MNFLDLYSKFLINMDICKQKVDLKTIAITYNIVLWKQYYKKAQNKWKLVFYDYFYYYYY